MLFRSVLPFTFKRGDVLSFEAESSVASSTFVPSIIVNGNPVNGNGLTFSIESLEGLPAVTQNVDYGKYLLTLGSATDISGNAYPILWITNLESNKSFLIHIKNQTETVAYMEANLDRNVYMVTYSIIPINSIHYVYSLWLTNNLDNNYFSVYCAEPYIAASQIPL